MTVVTWTKEEYKHEIRLDKEDEKCFEHVKNVLSDIIDKVAYPESEIEVFWDDFQVEPDRTTLEAITKAYQMIRGLWRATKIVSRYKNEEEPENEN